MSQETQTDYVQSAPNEAEIEKNARLLALQFETAAGKKKWFKLLHILRQVKGETKASVEAKLEILITMDLAVAKSQNGETKYMITLTNEDRVEYLNDYKAHLERELATVQTQIERLQE